MCELYKAMSESLRNVCAFWDYVWVFEAICETFKAMSVSLRQCLSLLRQCLSLCQLATDWAKAICASDLLFEPHMSKENVTRFLNCIFFLTILTHLGLLFICWSFFVYGFNFAEIFAYAKKLRGVIDTAESVSACQRIQHAYWWISLKKQIFSGKSCGTVPLKLLPETLKDSNKYRQKARQSHQARMSLTKQQLFSNWWG